MCYIVTTAERCLPIINTQIKYPVAFGALMANKPKIGVHENIQAKDYHQWEAASYSRLKELHRSPAHCKYMIDYPGEPTDAMRLGSAVHKAILEPDAFNSTYVLFEGDLRKTADKDRYASLKYTYGEEGVLRTNDWNKVQAIKNSVWSVKSAKSLLKKLDHVELSIAWEYKEVLCKARIDGYIKDLKTVIDIKTTRDAGFYQFEKSLANLKYHWQAWHYKTGMNLVGLPVEHYIFIVIENTEPHAVAIYRLDDKAISIGGGFVDSLIQQYGDCLKNNNWPSYPDRIEDISLPSYLIKDNINDDGDFTDDEEPF